jgi:hypothetical protein
MNIELISFVARKNKVLPVPKTLPNRPIKVNIYYIPKYAQISSVNLFYINIININLHDLFVHILVYNKHLLINMHGMNIKIPIKESRHCVDDSNQL